MERYDDKLKEARSLNIKGSNEELRDRLKFLRVVRGYTQNTLSIATEIKKTTLQKIENGVSKKPRCIPTLCSALGCCPSYLQYGCKNNPTSRKMEEIKRRMEAGEKYVKWDYDKEDDCANSCNTCQLQTDVAILVLQEELKKRNGSEEGSEEGVVVNKSWTVI